MTNLSNKSTNINNENKSLQNFETLRDKCKKYLFGEVFPVEPANAGNVSSTL